MRSITRLAVLLGTPVFSIVAGTLLAGSLQPGYCPAGEVPLEQDEAGAPESLAARVRDMLGTHLCGPAKHPESLREMMRMNEDFAASWGEAPDGALRAAVEQKRAMTAAGLQETVPNANGAWSEFGQGVLVTDDPRYGSVNGLGIGFNSGRIDSFDYDPVNKRMFASIGTGGVWMSEDNAATWQDIGSNLPSLIVGQVAWTSAGGGTVLAGGGEPLNGGFTFVGLGAYWSNDLGATWNQATGVPDGIMTYQIEVDPGHPDIVYMGTSKGLYRSTDAGRTYTYIPLATTCNDLTDKKCLFANFVTDVVVKEPGGIATNAVTCNASGCPVLAVVGFYGAKRKFIDGTPMAPHNGLFRSDTGAAGTWTELSSAYGNGVSPVGFATQERIGRTHFGNATGANQDHNYVYAIVQDAVLLNQGAGTVDIPDPGLTSPRANNTYFNGIYASADFGSTWIKMADETELAKPSTGSSLTTYTAVAAGYAPGIQAWYNLYVVVDPTKADASGVPTRLVFGLEEVWTNRVQVPLNGVGQQGDEDFKVIGTYFAGDTCQFVGGLPVCPTNDPGTITTTHPDQHAAIFIPDASGGIDLFVGNDGGVYKQHAAAADELSNSKWNTGSNVGFYTLLPYSVAVAKDCTVWFGLQDNGSGRIQPDNRKIYETYGGDGTFAAVDPANSNIAYTSTPGNSLQRTTDGGTSFTGIAPTITNALFVNPFKLDPTDASHMLTGGTEIVESLNVAGNADWTQVFTLGTGPGGAPRSTTAVDVHGDAAYTAFCGFCGVRSRIAGEEARQFSRGIATNVGGSLPPKKGAADGWHFATMTGLPNRYITSIDLDPTAPSTVYVTLGGYSNAQWQPPGMYSDQNPNIGVGHVFKSTNAGESFTDVSGNLPNLPIFWVHLREGQLIVGTQIGPFISTDTTGATWAPMGTGMPNVPVLQTDRFLGDKTQLYAATFGRGVWRYRFPGEADICPIPAGPLVAAAPVQLSPNNIDTAGTGDACSTDSDGSYTLNFTYTKPDGGNDPSGFRVQEATVFEVPFQDDASEPLSGGSNSKWSGTSGWVTSVNPGNGAPAYFVPSTNDQNERLEMKDAVTLLAGGGTLTFDTTQDTEACCDFAHIEVTTDDGANWTEIGSASGTFTGTRVYDLNDFGNQTIKIRFRLTSDPLVPGAGWYINNIQIDTNDFTTIGEPGPTAATFDRTRGNGTWYYRVAALFDRGGPIEHGPYSNVKCVTVSGVANLAPLANAGIDFAVNENTGAALSGASSSDPENGVLTYQWTQTAGPNVTLSNANTAMASFTAPSVAADTPLSFQLKVTDDGGLESTDSVIVTVRNVAGGGGGGSTADQIGDNHVGGLPPATLLMLGLVALGRRRSRR